MWHVGPHDGGWTPRLGLGLATSVNKDTKIQFYDYSPETKCAFNDRLLLNIQKFAGKLESIGQVETEALFTHLTLEFKLVIRSPPSERRRHYIHGCFPRVVIVARRPLKYIFLRTKKSNLQC